MGSVTCERCGFVSFATSEVCKQCGGALPGPRAALNWRPPQPTPQPNWQPQQPQAAHDWQYQQQQYQQQTYAADWPPPPAQGWTPPHGGSAHYQSQPGYYHAGDDGLPKRKGMAAVSMLCGLLALPVMIAGAFAAIALGAPAAILGAVACLVMTILALTLGIAGTVRVNRNPAEFGGKGMAVAGIILGSLLLIGIVPMGIVASIAIPNLLASRRAANEGAAINSLRQIAAAEATYQSTAGAGKFGSMEELNGQQLLSPQFSNGELSGYRFEIEADGDTFWATATPVNYPSTGLRSFYVSESGVIQGADKGGEPADEDDPPLNDRTYGSVPVSADGSEVY